MTLKDIFNKLPKSHSVDMMAEDEDNSLRISMRTSPDDEPSEETYAHARAVVGFLKEKHPEVKIETEIVDEWIDLTLSFK